MKSERKSWTRGLKLSIARPDRRLRVCNDDELPRSKLWHRRHFISDEKLFSRSTLRTRTCGLVSPQSSGKDDYPRTAQGTMLQLPRIRPCEERLHKQQEAMIWHANTVLAVQPDDKQRCRVPCLEKETQRRTHRREMYVHTQRLRWRSRKNKKTSGMPSWPLQGHRQHISRELHRQPRMGRLPLEHQTKCYPKPLTMLIDSGTSGHYVKDEFHQNPKE